MQNMLTAERTKLLDLDPIRMFFLILRSAVINTAAFCALKLDWFTHYIKIIVIKNLDIKIQIHRKIFISPSGCEAPDRN